MGMTHDFGTDWPYVVALCPRPTSLECYQKSRVVFAAAHKWLRDRGIDPTQFQTYANWYAFKDPNLAFEFKIHCG